MASSPPEFLLSVSGPAIEVAARPRRGNSSDVDGDRMKLHVRPGRARLARRDLSAGPLGHSEGHRQPPPPHQPAGAADWRWTVKYRTTHQVAARGLVAGSPQGTRSRRRALQGPRGRSQPEARRPGPAPLPGVQQPVSPGRGGGPQGGGQPWPSDPPRPVVAGALGSARARSRRRGPRTELADANPAAVPDVPAPLGRVRGRWRPDAVGALEEEG